MRTTPTTVLSARERHSLAAKLDSSGQGRGQSLVLIAACACGRGVKLDELIEKSDDLSASSKMFYTTAKKHNQCCDIM